MERRILEASYFFNSGRNVKNQKYSDGNIIVYAKDYFHPNNEAFHTHNFFEFELILDGKGKNITFDGETTISRGTLIFETPAGMHTLNSDDDSPLKLINVEFAGELEQIVLENLGNLDSFCINLSEQQLCYIERELREILFVQDLPGLNMELFAQGVARKLISYICRIVGESNIPQPDNKTFASIGKAILYIRRNYAKRIKLSDVAKSVNFSPNYLGSLLKKQTGRTFMQYLLDIRLDNAYRLISCTDKSVKEVCIEVGYSSYSNFFYAFKEKFGFQPTELKNLSHDQKAQEFYKKRAYINNWKS